MVSGEVKSPRSVDKALDDYDGWFYVLLMVRLNSHQAWRLDLAEHVAPPVSIPGCQADLSFSHFWCTAHSHVWLSVADSEHLWSSLHQSYLAPPPEINNSAFIIHLYSFPIYCIIPVVSQEFWVFFSLARLIGRG